MNSDWLLCCHVLLQVLRCEHMCSSGKGRRKKNICEKKNTSVLLLYPTKLVVAYKSGILCRVEILRLSCFVFFIRV